MIDEGRLAQKTPRAGATDTLVMRHIAPMDYVPHNLQIVSFEISHDRTKKGKKCQAISI